MIKNYVIYYVLFTLYIKTKIKCDTAEVIWDDSNDVIYYEGKLYYTSDKINVEKNDIFNLNLDQNSNNRNKNNLEKNLHIENKHHEEELATGAKFWFYCFMILRIFNFLYFINLKSIFHINIRGTYIIFKDIRSLI